VVESVARSEHQVYQKLLELSTGPTGSPQIGELVLMSALCRSLDSVEANVEPAARALEARGWIVCAPSTGRIAVLALAKAAGQGEFA
jgi:hypothetical protein